MSKPIPKSASAKHERSTPDIIPARMQHPAALLVLLAALVIFFAPVVLNNKTFLPPDNIASHSWDTLLKDADAQGVFPLWNPYIFCGMPGYASLTVSRDRFFDISSIVLARTTLVFQYLMLNSPVGWVLCYYFLFAAGMYLFVFSKLGSKVAALAAALGATFSTYIIMWVMISHNTKISVLAFFPFILYVIERLREKFDWRYALALVLLLHFSFLPAHIQMIFYVYLALGIYFLFFLVRTLVKREDWKPIVRTGVVFALASMLAFAMDADKYLSVWEYNTFSIRGSAPLVQAVEAGGKTQEGGLGYDYATNWSFAPGEMMTFLVPSWYGFGPLEYTGRLTPRPQVFNLYWGPQPFVDAAPYMGIIILSFALVGFWKNRRDPFVQFSAVTIVFALLVSFGKEFSFVYDLMFKYFPMFNKFRVPSMSLVLVQVLVPVLSAYGIRSLMSEAAAGLPVRTEKRWKTGLAIGAILLAASFLARGVFESIYTGTFPLKEVSRRLMYALQTNQPEVLTEFYNFIVATVTTDIAIAFGFLVGAFGVLWLAAKRTVSMNAAAVVIVVLLTADLWRIDWRPMDPKERTQQAEAFSTPPFAQFLQRDTELYRIILIINGQLQYDNTLAYWRIQNVYGYQGAKMRAFQDIVDVVGLGNPLVMQLMNVKYIVSNRVDSVMAPNLVYDGPDMKVYRNPASGPRAFFVNRYETATGKQTLDKMAALSFNPTDVAFFIEDPKLTIDAPQDGASAEFVHYGIQDLTVKVNATGNNLLFLSEAWYPNGWKALIDGSETPIHRVNYMFRSVVVPKGPHTLEMRFEPSGFALGKKLSLAGNILVVCGLGYGGFDWWRKKKGKKEEK